MKNCGMPEEARLLSGTNFCFFHASPKKMRTFKRFTLTLLQKPALVAGMRRLFFIGTFVVAVFACNTPSSDPARTAPRVTISFRNFDRSLFALDTSRLEPQLAALQQQDSLFCSIFFGNVLGLGSTDSNRTLLTNGVRLFLRLHRGIADTANTVFGNRKKLEGQLVDGFTRLHYYFPEYELPKTIYWTVGPMDALPPMSNGEPSPNFLGPGFAAIGMQFYLGPEFSIYNDPGYASSYVPQFRSRRFRKEYVAADLFTLVLDDLLPDSSKRLPLIEQFVERGKRKYLLHLLLPQAHDSILLGYTGKQLAWCRENERSIFNFFAQQQLLYERDPALVQGFVTDGPFTQGMPAESPGNIANFMGIEIVRAWMKRNPQATPAQLLRTDARTIYNGAAYKPR